jgi:hypothetical protein
LAVDVYFTPFALQHQPSSINRTPFLMTEEVSEAISSRQASNYPEGRI